MADNCDELKINLNLNLLLKMEKYVLNANVNKIVKIFKLETLARITNRKTLVSLNS